MDATQKLDANNLRKLQLTELSLLKNLHRVCEKYSIPYFICYGSAIGAIRHKGFIPWDDDIDVGMMRSDYEKLKNVPKYEWESFGVSLVDPSDKCDSHLWTYPRLYKNGTVFESGTHYYEIKRPNSETSHLRIWLDIFLYDRFDSVGSIEKTRKKAFWLKKQYYYSVCDRNIRKSDSFVRKIIGLFEKGIHWRLSLYKDPKAVIWKRYQRLFSDTGDIVTTLDTPYDPKLIMCSIAEMFPLKDIVFEDINVKIQSNYDKVMRNIYGDYLKLPPVEKRVTHAPVILDFGQGNVMETKE